MAKCRATTAHGQSCGAQALRDSEFCFVHDPASGQARALARKRGGQRNRTPHAGNSQDLPTRVRTLQDVLMILDYALAEALPLENSIQRGRLLVAIAGTFIEAIKTGELESRIEGIEYALRAGGEEMNINRARKNYGKLTAKERFSAFIAAFEREDDEEYKALLDSAPRKSLSAPHTYGLWLAFRTFSMFHGLIQLGNAALYYFVLGQGEEAAVARGYDFEEIMASLQRRILEAREVWRVICYEYGWDYKLTTSLNPHADLVEMTELMADIANFGSPPELSDLQERISTFRDAIDNMCKEWE